MSVRRLLASALLALLTGCASTGGGTDRVVYHLNEGLAQASNGLRNINNHLEVNPEAKIVVVSHALGVDFLMKGAQDKNGN
ncbi:MAG: DsrE family protein, partial [Burkholderiales bacterium]